MTYLSNSNSESTIRLEKYSSRIAELEEQSVKHNELHEKMKLRLKEMTARIQIQNEEVVKIMLKYYLFNNLFSKPYL